MSFMVTQASSVMMPFINFWKPRVACFQAWQWLLACCLGIKVVPN